jgi:hypothetical protein
VFLDPFQELQIEIDGGITRSVSPVGAQSFTLIDGDD